MKATLLAIAVVLSIMGLSQEGPNYYKDHMKNRIHGKALSSPDDSKNEPNYFSRPDSLKKESIVVKPLKDGMPCIVPNMRKFNKMPNAAKPEDLLSLSKKPGAIPNPYKQQRQEVKPLAPPAPKEEHQNASPEG